MQTQPFDWPWRHIVLTYLVASISSAATLAARAAKATGLGETIYAAQCAHCHGPRGEGSQQNKGRLEGDHSVARLAEIINETMPDDDPGSLSDSEVRAVAEYIHNEFYSPIARARSRPARIELARLTVNQYRLALADLIASFELRNSRPGEGRGLRGDYFNSREPAGRNKRVAMRIDPQVVFNFGTEAPAPGIDDPHHYSVRWTGSVLAPETGQYEFTVRTAHAARLWVNDKRRPLIDAWVKSGDETDHAASVYLVGGRPYALRLDFSNAMQGVNDAKERNKDRAQVAASIELLWQRPHRVQEPIAESFLAPDEAAETFVCATPFPPDDRSYGWERATEVSKAWDEATSAAAIAAAAYVAERLNDLAHTQEEAFDRPLKLRAFATEFAERAFRQPLDGALRMQYVDRQFEVMDDFDAAVRQVVLMVLKSPRFLFRELGGQRPDFDVAARLSFGLWNSIPDDQLLLAARRELLSTDDSQIRQQAERMLADPRARNKLRHFLLTWLKLDGHGEIIKDSQQFEGFDSTLASDMRTSLELFLDAVVWSESSDFRELFLAENVFLNERLAHFYGAQLGFDPGFHPVRLDDGKRAGVLTHPEVMAHYAYSRETSPIHRGVFLARGVLGQSLRPPPEAFTPLAPDLHPDLTTRERVALQTNDTACMSCHAIINPLGFTLERFDAVGRYREIDRGKPIDDTAEYQDTAGRKVMLQGARDLALYLTESESAHTAFVEQMFHYLVQQSDQAYGPTMLPQLRLFFENNEFHIRKLAVEIMVATARIGRETVD